MSGIFKAFLFYSLVACGLTIAGLLLADQAVAAPARCKPSDITQHEGAQLALLAAGENAPGIALIANLELLQNTDGQPMEPGAGKSLNFSVLAARPKSAAESSIAFWYSVDKRTVALSDAISKEPIAVTPAVKAQQARLRKLHCLN